MTKIINDHKHILELDNSLYKIIPTDSLFVSTRKNRSIGDFLINSKLRPINQEIAVNDSPDPHSDHGCFGCEKCYMCKFFLLEGNTFTSYHTSQVFAHKSKILCSEEGVIYIINCNTCLVSYTGYTILKMVSRLSNDKSHIKYNKKTCEITKHYININHDLDFSSIVNYNNSLSSHMNVCLIESVNFEPGMTSAQKEKMCQTRETFWQTQLKCFTRYGGLNKRENKKYEKTK